MVNWKIALVVVILAALVIAIGMWFGYRYVSDQGTLSPEGQHDRSKTAPARFDTPLVLSLSLVDVSQETLNSCNRYTYLFKKGI